MMRATLGVMVGCVVWTALWLAGNAVFFGAVDDQIGVWRVMPIWYHLAFLLLIVPVCVASGRLWRFKAPGAAS